MRSLAAPAIRIAVAPVIRIAARKKHNTYANYSIIAASLKSADAEARQALARSNLFAATENLLAAQRRLADLEALFLEHNVRVDEPA